MTILSVRTALESALNAVLPIVDTAWENTDYTPSVGVPYQKVHLMTSTSNPTIGGVFHRVSGIFQIDLMYPPYQGVRSAETQAEKIKTLFHRSESFEYGGVIVNITNTPSIRSMGIEDGRYRVMVEIKFLADIF
ncbi:MAG: hypothetical protein H8E42_05115 [Nitrospinae bacterium]|nr:hypothetical protein [Nitrospinota bacterium]